MNVTHTLQQLRQLEPIEAVGLRCFENTGHITDFFQAHFLLTHGARSGAVSFDPQEYKQIQDMVKSQYFDESLPESLFMPEETNVELEHLLRYVDIIPHSHDFFELVCVIEGSCLHTLAGQKCVLGAGDISIVPPGLPHHLKAEPDCVCITIKVRTSTFDRAFSSMLQGQSLLSVYFAENLYTPQTRSALTFHCGADDFVPELLLYMFRQQQEKRAYCDSIIEGMISVLFNYLLQNHQDSLEFSTHISQHSRRIGEVLNYLGTHYSTATLTDTANTFYMNPSYLSTCIRKATGHTFSQLVRTYRMRRAAELLEQSNLKLEDICEQIGYQDVTQFIRYFKETYHCTPHVYRKQKLSQRLNAAAPGFSE